MFTNSPNILSTLCIPQVKKRSNNEATKTIESRMWCLKEVEET